jgi:hypothetical protein
LHFYGLFLTRHEVNNERRQSNSRPNYKQDAHTATDSDCGTGTCGVTGRFIEGLPYVP